MSSHPFHLWSIFLEIAFLPVMFALGGWFYFVKPEWAGYTICAAGSAVAIFYWMSIRSLYISWFRSQTPQAPHAVSDANIFFTNSLISVATRLVNAETVRKAVRETMVKSGMGEIVDLTEECQLVPGGKKISDRKCAELMEGLNIAIVKMLKPFMPPKKVSEEVVAAWGETVKRYPGNYPSLGGLSSELELPPWLLLLQPGKSFLLEVEKVSEAFETIARMAKSGVPVVCISLTHPKHLRETYPLGTAEFIWLSKEGEGAVGPSELEKLHDRILSLATSEGHVVFLDGIEFLIRTNGFEVMLRFLKDLVDWTATNRKILLIPVQPMAMEREQLSMLHLMMISRP
jgi:hypothetical protein